MNKLNNSAVEKTLASVPTANAIKNNNSRSIADTVYVIKWKAYDCNTEWFYKIGVTSKGRELDRLIEILKSFFHKYRYTPYASIKRFRVSEKPYEIEAKLHQKFKDKKVYFDQKFGGSSEFFKADEDDILKAFDELLPKKK